MELMGDIPKSLIGKSHNSKEFFHSSGKFKEKKPSRHPLANVLREDVEIECSDSMIYLLEKMLAIDPASRYDYGDIIGWYQNSSY
jgi:hypothetical protein